MKLARRLAGIAILAALAGCSSSTAILGELDRDAADASLDDAAIDAPAVCSAGLPYCMFDDAYLCDASGASFSLVATCPNGCAAGACLPEQNCGSAAFLDGSSGRIGSSATVDSAFTFEAWFFPVTGVGVPYGRIAGVEATGACASGTDNWEIRLAADGTISASLGAGFTTTGTGATVAFSEWVHVALVYDGAQTGRLFVNGVLAQGYGAAATPTFGAGCALRVATADNGSSLRARMLLGSVRYSSSARYAADFARPITMTRDPNTMYLFDMPASGGVFPLLDGSALFEATNATLVTAGPGC